MTDQHQHQRLTGPAATEAATRLVSFAAFAGQVTTDPRRITRLIASHDPAVYPGEYVTLRLQPRQSTVQPRRRPGSRHQAITAFLAGQETSPNDPQG